VCVLSRLLQCLALWLRCHHSFVACLKEFPPPQYLGESLSCCMRLLPLVRVATLDLAAVDAASPSEELHSSMMSLLDAHSCCAVSLQPLPRDSRNRLIALLIYQLQPHGASIELGPSGRLRPEDTHGPAGILRRLLLAANDADFGWTLASLLTELSGRVPDASRARPLLLAVAHSAAASSLQHVAHLAALQQRLLSSLRRTALNAENAHGHVEADSVRRISLQALTALATNDQLKFSSSDGAIFLHATASLLAHVNLKASPLWLPSAAAFNAAYFLLMALLRQRPKVPPTDPEDVQTHPCPSLDAAR